jgi:hypothetical protein
MRNRNRDPNFYLLRSQEFEEGRHQRVLGRVQQQPQQLDGHLLFDRSLLLAALDKVKDPLVHLAELRRVVKRAPRGVHVLQKRGQSVDSVGTRSRQR